MLDLSAFYAPDEGDGRRNAPYEPRMMLKVLIYAYASGVFSSRKIARKLEEDIAFRVLGFRRFSLRGLQAVRGEWDLVCMVTNLRRMQPLMVIE